MNPVLVSAEADQLLVRLDPSIVSIARGYARGNAALLDDLAQVGRIAAWRSMESYNPTRGPSLDEYALYRARSRMVDHLRAERRQVAPADVEIESVAQVGRGVDELLDARRAVADQAAHVAHLAAGIELLGETRDRRIAELVLEGESTATAIAVHINVSRTRARTLIRRAMTRLENVVGPLIDTRGPRVARPDARKPRPRA